MKKIKLSLLTLMLLFLSGCSTKSWQISEMEYATDLASERINNGEIPESMQEWKIVADVSDNWLNCNYDFVLPYTKISIDQQNRIWIYGPDQSNGPIGGIPDNPGCSSGSSPRVIVYDQESDQTKLVYPSAVNDGLLSTASGWAHLDRNKVLLNSVFIYKSAWDSPDGGKGNQYIDLAIFENGSFKTLFNESDSEFAVPDLAISEDQAYVIFDSVKDAHPQILVFDLNTEKLISRDEITVCENPRSIELSGTNLFILCKEESQKYSLYVLTKDYSVIGSMKEKITFAPNLLNNGDGFPLSVDAKGRVWVGFSYIAETVNNNWVLNAIFPDGHMVEFNNGNFYPKPVFGVVQYKGGMLFSLNGGLFFADYDNHKWEILHHSSSPLPIAEDRNGKIYTFTGKYILTIP